MKAFIFVLEIKCKNFRLVYVLGGCRGKLNTSRKGSKLTEVYYLICSLVFNVSSTLRLFTGFSTYPTMGKYFTLSFSSL